MCRRSCGTSPATPASFAPGRSSHVGSSAPGAPFPVGRGRPGRPDHARRSLAAARPAGTPAPEAIVKSGFAVTRDWLRSLLTLRWLTRCGSYQEDGAVVARVSPSPGRRTAGAPPRRWYRGGCRSRPTDVVLSRIDVNRTFHDPATPRRILPAWSTTSIRVPGQARDSTSASDRGRSVRQAWSRWALGPSMRTRIWRSPVACCSSETLTGTSRFACQ